MNDIKFIIFENPESKNKNFCFVVQSEKENYENKKYGLACLSPLSMLLKSENKKDLEKQIEEEKKVFESSLFFRIAPNLGIHKNKIFSFLVELFFKNQSKLFDDSIFELSLKNVCTFPKKAFTASPFGYIEDKKKLEIFKKDFFDLIKKENKIKYNFIEKLFEDTLSFLGNIKITQDSIEENLINKIKNILLLSENSHFLTGNPFFTEKWENEKNEIIKDKIIISYNETKKTYLLEEGHHRIKAIYELIKIGKLDIGILDIFQIEFKETKISGASSIGVL